MGGALTCCHSMRPPSYTHQPLGAPSLPRQGLAVLLRLSQTSAVAAMPPWCYA